MTPGSHARPTETPPRRIGNRARRGGVWRLGSPVVVLLCGALFVISAHNSQGTDLRPGRYTSLASLVRNEADDYDALKQKVASLNEEVAALTGSVNDREVKRYQRKTARLEDPAGLTPRVGPGVTVTLSDAPDDVLYSTDLDPNLLVVHQQDIQAVVNAMWKAGASAVTIAGQRVVSTTGIKCLGNSVQLQGLLYSPPYEISAVGDQSALLSAIENDTYLQLYRKQAVDPRIGVGWAVALETSVTAPAFDGLLDLSYARPLP